MTVFNFVVKKAASAELVISLKAVISGLGGPLPGMTAFRFAVLKPPR